METTEKLTRREIVHYVTLFFYNWTKQDFIEIYKNSRVGELYFWNKLQGKLSVKGSNSTEAAADVFMNMDNTHQQLLIDYVLDKKYKDIIQSAREWQKIIEKVKSENEND